MIFNNIRIITFLCGLSSLLLASVVIFGWYTNNQLLVQIHSSFAPMQFNTAAGFFLCGLGLMLLFFDLKIPSKLAGATVFIVALATIFQYFFDTDFAIDNIFAEPVFFTKTSHPGRMAPLTALCFSLYGLILLANDLKRTIVIGLSAAVIALSSLALFSYLTEHESIYGWGNLTRMAIHTACTFLVLSLGAIAYNLNGLKKQKIDLWQLSPPIASIMVAVLTLFASYVFEEEAKAGDKAYLNNLIEKTQDGLLDRYHLYEKSLRGGLGLFYASDNVSRGEWKKYISALDLDKFLPGINGIGFIERVSEKDLEEYIRVTRLDNRPNFKNYPETQNTEKYIIKYIEPFERNAKAEGLDIAFEKNRREAAELATETAQPTLTNKIDLVQDNEKKAGFLLLIPVYENDETPNTPEHRQKYLKGWVYAPFIAPNFFEEINNINGQQLNLRVYDGQNTEPNNLIHEDSEHKNTDLSLKNTPIETTFKIAEKTWTLTWSTNKNYAPPSTSNQGSLLLALGLGLAAFLFFTLNRLVHSKRIVSATVERRTKELREANEELEEFSYRTSHDLRSPLVSSIGLLEVVQDSLEKDNKEVAQKSVHHIKNSLEKLDILVQDILALTQTKNAQEDVQEVDINNIISEAIFKLDHMENFERINIIKDLRYSEKLFSKKSRIALIIENFISNAAKYQDLEKSDPFIKLSTYQKGKTFVFEISDNGLGIPKDQQSKMFVMFKRFHSRVAYGSGLGLYMTKKSAQALNGDVFYEDLGDGTMFKLIIPIRVNTQVLNC